MSGRVLKNASRSGGVVLPAFGAALAFLAAGCEAVHPVRVAPPTVPLAYVTEVPSAPPRPPQDRSSAPGIKPALGETPRSDADTAGAIAEPASPTASAAPSTNGPPPPLGAGWWTVFADPALDAAIEEALRNNYFLRDVRMLIHENQLDPARPNGLLWPLQISVPGTAQHISAGFPSPGPGQPPYSLTYEEADIGVTASYEVDVWGRLDARRQTFDSQVEQQRQSTEIVAQDLAQQVAELWFQLLEQRALGALLEDQVHYSQDLLTVVKARFDQHLASRLVVLQQEQQLLATQAQVPLVTAQIAVLTSQLSALLGRMPTPNARVVPDDRRLPDLPPPPSVGTPIELLHSSPELHFVEAKIAESEHRANENLASWLPIVELFGNAGIQSFNFTDNYPTGAAGVRLTWPIFDGGQRILRAKQLDLTVHRRKVQYELAFKAAIQRVQEALVLEHKQADHVRAVHAQVDLGRNVLVEARELFEQGSSDYLPVLTALASLSSLERASIQAQRVLLTDRIRLYRALGGAWSRAATTIPD